MDAAWNLPSSVGTAQDRPSKPEAKSLACGFPRLDRLGLTKERDWRADRAAARSNTSLVYQDTLHLSTKICLGQRLQYVAGEVET